MDRGNSVGRNVKPIRIGEDMEVFDSLPDEVRHALNYGDFNFGAADTAMLLRQHSPHQVVAFIAQANRNCAKGNPWPQRL